MNETFNAKRTDPLVPADHPDFVWTAGGDVQSTWRRYGWISLEEISGKKESPKYLIEVVA